MEDGNPRPTIDLTNDNNREAPTHRNIVFTVNLDPEDDDRFSLIDFSSLVDRKGRPLVRYGIYQLEIGENGHEHLQGYIELERPCRFSQIHTIPGLENAWFDIRRGNRDQAIAYASKQDTRLEGPFEYGTRGITYYFRCYEDTDGVF